jgi:AbrB family looped-hinge helix DNA binding protein
MKPIKISPKFQIVIPRGIREQLHLKAGQQLMPVVSHDKLQFLLVKDIKNYRGVLKGIEFGSIREKKDREV